MRRDWFEVNPLSLAVCATGVGQDCRSAIGAGVLNQPGSTEQLAGPQNAQILVVERHC